MQLAERTPLYLPGLNQFEADGLTYAVDAEAPGLISTRRRLAAATGYLDGKISPDGGRVGILRGVVLRDRPLKQFSIMSSDSGPETPVGSPQNVVGWEWAPDGSKVLLAVRERGDSLTIKAVDLPGGATRIVAKLSAAKTGAFAALPGGGLAVVSYPTQLRRIGVPGLADSILDVPEDLIGIAAVSPTPGGLTLAMVEVKRQFDTLLISRVSLVDGHAGRVAAFLSEGDPTGDPPAWMPDGSLIVSVRQNQNVVWYRIPRVEAVPSAWARRHGVVPPTAGRGTGGVSSPSCATTWPTCMPFGTSASCSTAESH